MKRWAIGILSVSTLAGLGWFGFSWFGQGGGSETPPPNFAAGPVNAEAAATMDNHRGGSNTPREDPARTNAAWSGQNSPDSAAGQRSANDPFQRVRQTSGTTTTIMTTPPAQAQILKVDTQENRADCPPIPPPRRWHRIRPAGNTAPPRTRFLLPAKPV